jgi:GDPmannose 4,6-dehydratase
VTGISGQDGSFLAELLLERDYAVTGTTRRSTNEQLGCSEHLRGRIEIVQADLLEVDRLREVVGGVRPDELYHLAAPSFVPDSWRDPAETMAAIAGSTAALLTAVRDGSPASRVFVATSGAMFGAAPASPQREDTLCRPESPYASAKLAAHQLVGQLRARYGIFACSGILYNHESERRPESFVTRKITRAAARIKLGLADHVALGDLRAVRDWSFAGDIVRGAWLMLQSEQPDDYILASGAAHSVAEFAEVAFAHVGLDADRYVRLHDRLMRAPESVASVGDPSRAKERLGWTETIGFEQLVVRMVDADLRALEISQGLAPSPHGGQNSAFRPT